MKKIIEFGIALFAFGFFMIGMVNAEEQVFSESSEALSHGPDVEILGANSQYTPIKNPEEVVGLLEVKYKSDETDKTYCTGTLIMLRGHFFVVTAAQCVYTLIIAVHNRYFDTERKIEERSIDNIKFTVNPPKGSTVTADRWFVPEEWKTGAKQYFANLHAKNRKTVDYDHKHNYALIHLKESRLRGKFALLLKEVEKVMPQMKGLLVGMNPNNDGIASGSLIQSLRYRIADGWVQWGYTQQAYTSAGTSTKKFIDTTHGDLMGSFDTLLGYNYSRMGSPLLDDNAINSALLASGLHENLVKTAPRIVGIMVYTKGWSKDESDAPKILPITPEMFNQFWKWSEQFTR